MSILREFHLYTFPSLPLILYLGQCDKQTTSRAENRILWPEHKVPWPWL